MIEYQPEFDPEIVRLRIKRSEDRYYVYVLCRPDGTPFYVGKGVADRVFAHESYARNLPIRSHKLNVIRALHRRGLRVGYVLDGFFPGEPEAHARERDLIQTIGRHDLGTGPLTNQTDGGEGTSNPSDESRIRRAATLGGNAEDPERRAINDFFNSIRGRHHSVPIKPVGSRALLPLTPHPSSRQPTERMVKALVAAAMANEIHLEPNCRLPRVFNVKGAKYAIENGVGRDMLKAGLVRLLSSTAAPESEILVLTPQGYDEVIRFIGFDRLLDLGVVEPTEVPLPPEEAAVLNSSPLLQEERGRNA